MKFKDLASYLILPVREDVPERYLIEMKRREWIFIAVRFLWVPVIFILGRLHQPGQMAMMMILGGALGVINIFACFFNARIKTPVNQKTLGIVMLAVDTFVGWGIILLFVRDFYTAAYAAFVYVIIEGAIRYSLRGSLVMAACFIIGLYAAYTYRSIAFDVRFSFSGFVFWAVVMTIVAVVVGAIVEEGKRQRAISESRLRENTLLTERHRLARELHDTVLKTLQGLSLEARALAGRTAETTPSVKETAQYIEEVCSRTGREIREVIFELRNEDALAGIGAQIARMLDQWSKTTGISGKFNLTGQDKATAPEAARQLKNIVSEALTNIQRHAAASAVTINVNITGARLDVEITDNGHGMERGTDELYAYVAEGRLGLAGMRERAELLGGRFTIASDRSGTRIGINIPLLISPEKKTDE